MGTLDTTENYLGTAVRRARVMAGMGTREELAVKAEVSSDIVRSLEKGNVNGLTVVDAHKIILHLGLDSQGLASMRKLVNLISPDKWAKMSNISPIPPTPVLSSFQMS